jgi:hypothetical protein
MLEEPPIDLDAWVELLRPAAPTLMSNLQNRFLDASSTSTQRVAAARVLASYADAHLLSELLLQADASQFSMLLPGASRHKSDVIATIRQAMKHPVAGGPRDHAKRQRNLIAAFLRLECPADAEPLLSTSPDPTGRTLALLEMRDFGVPLGVVLTTFEGWKDPSARQALLLALEPYRGRDMLPHMEQDLIERLVRLLRESPHQAERSGAEWLLSRWGRAEMVDEQFRKLAETNLNVKAFSHDRDWYVTGQGQTMAVVNGPVSFSMGSPEGEPGIAHAERLITQTKIAYSFAVSVNEISMEQFRQFRANAQFAWERADPQCPANRVSFDDAIRYCRWLSAKEGIPEEEMCYPADFVASDSVLPEQRLLRTGYRLPTELEWEFTCRAGTTTPWFSGDDEEHLKAFAWFALNAGEQVRPDGSLRPNPLGIFDMLGNVAEWSHKSVPAGDYILRGGAYNQLSKGLRSAKRESQSKNGYSFTGFRIARTMVPKP